MLPIGKVVFIISIGFAFSFTSETTVDTIWCTWSKLYILQSSSTLTLPFIAVCERSFRTKSTIIIFSLRSFSSLTKLFFKMESIIWSSSRFAVPFIGCEIILVPTFFM